MPHTMRAAGVGAGTCSLLLGAFQVAFAMTAAAQSASPPQSAPVRASALHDLHSLPGSTLTILGSTTIGASWHCESTDVVAVVSVADRSGDPAASRPGVRGVSIRVPVSALHCQNGPMERAMRHALKADADTAAQVISGRFEEVDDSVPATAGALQLAGTLRVAGVDRPVVLHSVISSGADGSMLVHSEVPLSLAAFGIAPPRLLLGMVRARDDVTIVVDLRYALPVAAPPQALAEQRSAQRFQLGPARPRTSRR